MRLNRAQHRRRFGSMRASMHDSPAPRSFLNDFGAADSKEQGTSAYRISVCLLQSGRALRASGDIWTAPRILRLSLWIRRIWRVLRPGLLRQWLLWTWLLWTWLLRASRVAPLERTSDRFRSTPTRVRKRVQVARREPLCPTKLACVADIAMPRCKHTVAATNQTNNPPVARLARLR